MYNAVEGEAAGGGKASGLVDEAGGWGRLGIGFVVCAPDQLQRTGCREGHKWSMSIPNAAERGLR